MTIETVRFGRTPYKVRPVYWCYGFCGNVFVSVIGHTRMYAINKALRVIDPFGKL